MDTRIFYLVVMTFFGGNYSCKKIEETGFLLLSTIDSISFIYPKEMNHRFDLIETILQITDLSKGSIFMSVFDKTTWTIYFILQGPVSTIFRLNKRQNVNLPKKPKVKCSFKIASNWTCESIYEANDLILSSLSFDTFKRKLYWS
ncbi:unnamed protein product [Brachionus calyciflorus]|uniref:Uncharacterized protein n=1 Tax=Brachionus calyciflorus TaxID=104777 RepID=A0A814GYZ4_9BILA|nr:unnamed protein product [Brachionus calyciflorus]